MKIKKRHEVNDTDTLALLLDFALLTQHTRAKVSVLAPLIAQVAAHTKVMQTSRQNGVPGNFETSPIQSRSHRTFNTHIQPHPINSTSNLIHACVLKNVPPFVYTVTYTTDSRCCGRGRGTRVSRAHLGAAIRSPGTRRPSFERWMVNGRGGAPSLALSRV